jgi:hypothetical protein
MEYTLEQVLKVLEDKTVVSWCDIYERLGIAAALAEQNRYDVQYVLASAETQELIRDKLKENLTLKYKNSYRKKAIETMAGMDFLCYSPTTEKNIGGIKILLEK